MPDSEIKARIKPVCATCGSDEVKADAWAEWDVENQRYDIASTFDQWVCEPCGGECGIEWKDVE